MNREVVEQMENTVYAVQSIADLIGSQTDNAKINPDNLYFLLALVADKQQQLVTQLFTATA